MLDKLSLPGDEQVGVRLVRRALEEPLRQIARNAGKEGSVIVAEVKKGQAGSGYDALNDQFVDMFQAGIIDPAKVTRSALENAASIASMLLTTETLIADKPEKKEAAGAPPMPEY